MNFDKPSARKSRGNAAREISRDELLAKINSDRTTREAARQRLKAAVCLQRLFRGWRARLTLRQDLIDKWLQTYSNAAADLSCFVPALELSGCLLPLIFQAFKGLSASACSSSQQPGTGPVNIPGSSGAIALRGSLALLLRSMASPEPHLNFCSLAVDQDHQLQWLRHCCQLIRLCSAILQLPSASSTTPARTLRGNGAQCGAAKASSNAKVDSVQTQQLLQTAAARVMMVLTDDSLWKCFRSGDVATSQPCARLLKTISSTPVIAVALRTIVSRTPALSNDSTAESGSHPLQTTQAQSAEQQKHGLIVQMTMHAVLRPLIAHVPASSASTSGRDASLSAGCLQPNVEAAAAHLASHIITAPQLLHHLPIAARKQLTSPPVLTLITKALQKLSSPAHQPLTCKTSQQCSQPLTVLSSNSNSLRQAEGQTTAEKALESSGAAMLALGNLAGLVCGERVSKADHNNKLLQYLPKSQLLGQPGMAHLFLATARSLLVFATKFNHPGKPAANHTGHVDGLWPFAEGTFITQLLGSCGNSATAVAEVAGFYHLLLEGLPILANRIERNSPILNALAFGCNIQQSLWRWCAMTMGLPLEAPQEATRGWDVATLRAGIQGLDLDHAPKLGLFCRIYAHTLLVLDDSDFYERQDVLTLAQQRGIATALNALVFRTFCPVSLGVKAHSSQVKALPGIGPTSMLSKWAPILLRAMYERNVRRAYCPASLWLEPYHMTQDSDQQQEGFSAGAVVRALLQNQTASPIGLGMTHRLSGWPAAQAGLLGTAPQCIPFEQRLLVFRALVAEDKERGRWETAPSDGGPAPFKFTVHRGSLLQDGWLALRNAGAAAKGRLVVSFVNEQGMLEAGLDYGGLVKEFLEQAISTGFNADYGLFTSTPDGLAYPQPAATKIPNGLGLLEFLGLVVGKALYEGILLDLPLAPFFVARLQGRRPMFDDLAALDSGLYRSLVQLKRYEGDVTDLCLDFSLEDDTFGARTAHSLIPNGAQVPVTNSNKLHYIHLAADWHLNGRLGASSAAFARGLAQVIPPSWLKLFNTQEVNQLLGGGEGGVLDVSDMAAHAHYSGGYSKDHATIKLFWKVMSSLTDKQRQAFMRFVTSCSRAPLGGFKHLTPPLTLHKVPCEASLLAAVGGKDVDRLPSASTCYNMLKLPNYRRASTLKEKLLYAILSNAGFELS